MDVTPTNEQIEAMAKRLGTEHEQVLHLAGFTGNPTEIETPMSRAAAMLRLWIAERDKVGDAIVDVVKLWEEEMTRDELIESTAKKLADIVDQYIRESAEQPKTFEVLMEYTAAALHDAGLCVVPVDATEKMIGAAWSKITPEKQRQGISRLGPGPGVTDVYRSMIDAGKL